MTRTETYYRSAVKNFVTTICNCANSLSAYYNLCMRKSYGNNATDAYKIVLFVLTSLSRYVIGQHLSYSQFCRFYASEKTTKTKG